MAGWTSDGWLRCARPVPSPNVDERPQGVAVSLIIMHNISLPPGEYGGADVEALFTNRLDPCRHPYFEQLRGLRLSAHFFVRRDGEIVQFASVHQRAWHAGVSSWKGVERCNDFSVGIELEGTDDDPYSDAQYSAAAVVVRALHELLPVEDIVGHADVAPGRKTDPGPAFDWPRFRALLAG